MTRPEWRSTQLLAWTDRDGPDRPPCGASPAMWTATAATLGVVFSVILFTDALCPEHRAWVQGLSGFATPTEGRETAAPEVHARR